MAATRRASQARRADGDGSRAVAVGLALSLALHAGGVVWISTAWAGSSPSSRGASEEVEDERETPEDERVRLGVESSTRATINWLGFADPTPHAAPESETDQAALSIAPPGAPEAPSTPAPADGSAMDGGDATGASGGAEPAERGDEPAGKAIDEAIAEETAAEVGDAAAADETANRSVPVSASESASAEASAVEDKPAEEAVEVEVSEAEGRDAASAEGEADAVREESDEELAETAEEAAESAEPAETREAEPADSDAEPAEMTEPEVSERKPADAEGAEKESDNDTAVDADSPAESEDSAASRAAPAGKASGADSMPGIISDRESTPTSKAKEMSVRDWGKPAAGEGIRVNPVRPRFPDTLAVFRREISAVVLIDFGSDGRVRNVRYDTVKKGEREVRLDTGSPEANRVLELSVYNWTASGEEIEALAKKGEDAVITVRMDMRIRP